ncbi:OmpW family outer membrane protein [Bacteroides sp.]|uniref:OmpW family outer membrane protein n=1 Tax=Bacteroides sp. TaxID=29523 RepID=UPI001B62A4CC|nr:OmpW family outer membrane protein [Bacteroides sp.]MBP6065072.1 outer membrane beta-barrel protein [Bacteroides sp.]MBP6066502.1 outer membrane beta-barrel protein [Bacteroides sp.]MBP6935777.1 outer membrane beta-barrel protein [Bacteroides sp.]MBP8621343.1 outer membrane beta-barrel protein [Bacteroides sp.]MBP9507459.1 outer membrane beta-barrel protein [Bacteroides sp.]
MKTIKLISFKGMAVAALALLFALPAKAQLSDNKYGSIDWQFNVPLSNGFANDASGWGMNLEGGYFVTPTIGLGLFVAYHSNHEYYQRATLIGNNGTLTTDQQHTIYQIPFGVDARYQMNRGGSFQPYFGVKLGPNFAKVSSNYNIFESRENTWGFYVSPEVGLSIYPWAYGPGLHIAAYYSYATNKANVLTYSVDGLNNFGFRLGIAF